MGRYLRYPARYRGALYLGTHERSTMLLFQGFLYWDKEEEVVGANGTRRLAELSFHFSLSEC